MNGPAGVRVRTTKAIGEGFLTAMEMLEEEREVDVPLEHMTNLRRLISWLRGRAQESLELEAADR